MVATLAPPPTADRPGGLVLMGSRELCRRSGVSYRQLDYWTRTGAVRPRVPARGNGSQRQWARGDVELLRVLGRLAAMGCAGEAFRRAAHELAAELPDVVAPAWLVVDETGDVGVARSEGELAAWSAQLGRGCWVVPFHPPA